MFRLIRWFMDKLITLFSKDADRAFLDKASFPWIAQLEAHWEAIRDEFDSVMLEQDRIPNVEDISEDGNLGADRKPMSRGGEWKWFFLYGYGHKIEGNCLRCPKTAQLVESIPGMCGAIFAILAPGKHIPPHRGLYKGLLRYHLGLRIPGRAGLCRITVKNETRVWEEGRSFVFDDTFTHEVWNESDVRRIVLMIDIERPLVAPLATLNRLVLRWISSTSYITDAIRNVSALAEAGPRTSDATRHSEGTFTLSGRPLVSVIIPAFGRPDMLRKAVRSVLAQDLGPDRFEVIIVDSSPDERNAEVVAELQQEARCSLRCFRKNPEGPGPSRNLGAQQARGEYLAFLDSDCQASSEWLRKGVSGFQERVGIVQGRTIPEQGVPHSVFHRSIEVLQESCLYETANIFYRREAFEQAGGFLADRKGFSGKMLIVGEDVDLAWKVKRAGWKSRFADGALVMHAIVRTPAWRWFFQTRMSTVPLIIRRDPELRRFFYARYFFDRTQALLTLGLAGLLLVFFSPYGWILILPYAVDRASQPSQTLKGPFRLLRGLLYFPRDLATLGALLAGSIRYGALLL